MEKLMGTAELAERLGVSATSIRLWIKQGLIKPTITTAGGFARFSEENYERILAMLKGEDLEGGDSQ